MIKFDNLQLYKGERLWEYNSQQWLTLEKTAILSNIEYLQFKELNNIIKYKDCDLHLIELRK